MYATKQRKQKKTAFISFHKLHKHHKSNGCVVLSSPHPINAQVTKSVIDVWGRRSGYTNTRGRGYGGGFMVAVVVLVVGVVVIVLQHNDRKSRNLKHKERTAHKTQSTFTTPSC